MKKLLALVSCVFFVVSMSLVTFAAAPIVGDVGSNYPNLTDYTLPAGSSIIVGEVIGAATGWDYNPYTGALAAFDGDHGNCYDQRVTADYENEYAGIKADKKYILTATRILPITDVDWQAERMNGMAIQGSNDGDTWATLWQSDKAATLNDTNFITVTDFVNNDGYTMFRICNITGNHTAYRELQFFGYDAANKHEQSGVNVVGDVGANYPVLEGLYTCGRLVHYFGQGNRRCDRLGLQSLYRCPLRL